MAARRLASVSEAPATPDLPSFIDQLPDSYLHCRELGHTWRPLRATTDGRAYDRILRCPRCKTERHQVLTMRGHVVSNRYVYPDHYLTGGLGRLDGDQRDQLRLASVIRSSPTQLQASEVA